jgi:hypothetical protein
VHCRSGRATPVYQMEMTFHVSVGDSHGWKIRGNAHCEVRDGGTRCIIIKEGYVAKRSGKAYWVGEEATSGRAHVAEGRFNFDTNRFKGTCTTDAGRKGVYSRFELLEAIATATTIADVEAVMAPETTAVVVEDDEAMAQGRQESAVILDQQYGPIPKTEMVAISASSSGDSETGPLIVVASTLPIQDDLRPQEQNAAALSSDIV